MTTPAMMKWKQAKSDLRAAMEFADMIRNGHAYANVTVMVDSVQTPGKVSPPHMSATFNREMSAQIAADIREHIEAVLERMNDAITDAADTARAELVAQIDEIDRDRKVAEVTR